MFFPSIPTSRRRTTWRHDLSVDERCHVANSPSSWLRRLEAMATCDITEGQHRRAAACAPRSRTSKMAWRMPSSLGLGGRTAISVADCPCTAPLSDIS
jgi:hypothetical protein